MTNTTEPTDNALEEARTRLHELAVQIEAYRTASNVPASRMAEKFTQLKSYRPIERVLAKDFEEMKTLETHEKHLAAWESIVAQINTPTPKPTPKAFNDFPMALQLRNAFVRTMKKTGPNRFILLIAPAGRGKTQALQALRDIYKAPRITLVEASRVWRDKPLPLLKEIWKKLGKTDELGSGSAAMERIVATLSETRLCIAIDEGHYLGADQLNILTNLINNTPGEFILAGQPTLWSRLERDRGIYLETRQLTRNRLSCRISFGDLVPEDPDTAMLIDRRMKWLNGRSKEAVALLTKDVAMHGNLGFVRNVIERVEDALEDGAPQSWATFDAARKAELTER